jgi:hypothetical protein
MAAPSARPGLHWRQIGGLLAVVLPIVVIIGVAIYVGNNPQKGFVFTERWSALTAFFALVLVGWLADFLIRAVIPGDPDAELAAATDKVKALAAAAANSSATAGEQTRRPEAAGTSSLAPRGRAKGKLASRAARVSKVLAPVARVGDASGVTAPDATSGAADESDRAAVAAGEAVADLSVANVRFRRAGLKSLLVGADGRVSTSKVQAILWTFAVLYVLTLLLVAGRILLEARNCGAAGQPACDQPPVTALKDAFDNVVQHDLQPEYFALLGIPLGAAVAAKALTTNKVANGDLVKPLATQSGLGTGFAEIISNDRGETDAFDFQYFAFNLLTLAYFFVQFFTHVAEGLPAIPATLLVLSGVSGVTYTTKKALEQDVGPAITAASPKRVVLQHDPSIVIVGTGFLSPGRAATSLNRVLLDGRPLVTAPTDWSPTKVTASFPSTKAKLKAAGFEARAAADLVVWDDLGKPSAPFTLEIATPADW